MTNLLTFIASIWKGSELENNAKRSKSILRQARIGWSISQRMQMRTSLLVGKIVSFGNCLCQCPPKSSFSFKTYGCIKRISFLHCRLWIWSIFSHRLHWRLLFLCLLWVNGLDLSLFFSLLYLYARVHVWLRKPIAFASWCLLYHLSKKKENAAGWWFLKTPLWLIPNLIFKK